jgi:hypothetical protein
VSESRLRLAAATTTGAVLPPGRWALRARPAVPLTFALAMVVFLRLAINTERHIFNFEAAKPGVAAFDMREVEESLGEYRRVPGFEEKKRALEAFVARHGQQDRRLP